MDYLKNDFRELCIKNAKEDKTTPNQQIYDSVRSSLIESSELSFDEMSSKLPTYKQLKSSMYRMYRSNKCV